MSELALKRIAENKAKYARGEDARSLDLGYCGLTKVPKEVKEMYWLEKIILINNEKLITIANISDLINLRYIDCSNTKIKDLSPVLNIKKLDYLNCSNTKIYDLAPVLHFILYREIPIIYYEPKRRGLSPERMAEIRALRGSKKKVDARDRQEIIEGSEIKQEAEQIIYYEPKKRGLGPERMAEIRDLRSKEVDATNRQAIVESPEIKQETEQKNEISFIFSGCPLTNPPLEIVKQGNAAILQYFVAREKQGTQTLTEAKIVVVGAGESGKTTLIQKLLNPEHPVPNIEDKRTEGIKVTPYPIRPGQPNALTAWLWDFGGQELYHTTHQFFLTPDTLYLLLNDNRKNDTDFYYWLNILALRAGDACPILTIFNAKDKAPRQIVPDETLFVHFPGLLREAVDVDFADKDLRKIYGLKDIIERHFATLPVLGKSFPTFWVRVRETLAQRTEEYITWTQFRDLCQSQQIEEEVAMRVLAQTLHNLGVLLWFPEVFGLEDLLILQPQWCIDAVYKALDTQAVKDDFGRFSESDLHQIWSEERYRSQCTRLLKLMQHFDLCYPVEGSLGVYIAPQLLDIKPNYNPDFDATLSIVHRFQYEFMPAGLLTRFIARTSRQILAPYVWRTGVTLRWPEGTIAEVVENQFSKEIILRVSGIERKRRLSEMRQTLEGIHDLFRGLKYEERVACNCIDCSNNSNATTFPLGILEDYFQHGDPVICNNGTRKRITAKSILEGMEYRDTPRIFISYAHKDKHYKDEFITMIAPLVKKGLWKIWHEEYLLPGDYWNDEILKQFSEANVLVLLLTAPFFASDDKWDIEMSRAIERHQQGNALVIGVVVSDCLWEHTPFRVVQMLPNDGIPVERQKNRSEVWKAVAVKVEEAIMSWERRRI